MFETLVDEMMQRDDIDIQDAIDKDVFILYGFSNDEIREIIEA